MLRDKLTIVLSCISSTILVNSKSTNTQIAKHIHGYVHIYCTQVYYKHYTDSPSLFKHVGIYDAYTYANVYINLCMGYRRFRQPLPLGDPFTKRLKHYLSSLLTKIPMRLTDILKHIAKNRKHFPYENT